MKAAVCGFPKRLLHAVACRLFGEVPKSVTLRENGTWLDAGVNHSSRGVFEPQGVSAILLGELQAVFPRGGISTVGSDPSWQSGVKEAFSKPASTESHSIRVQVA